MTRKAFEYMLLVESVADRTGRFDVADVSRNDEQIELLMAARDRGWLEIASYGSRITPEGRAALLSEKEKRDQVADNAAHTAKGRMKAKVSDVAVSVLVAAIASAVGAVVAHWLQ